jgi:hypothetical protein
MAISARSYPTDDLAVVPDWLVADAIGIGCVNDEGNEPQCAACGFFFSGGFASDGFKLRSLVARPDGDDHTFVYGLGFELSFNAKRWDTNRISSEFRPIVGWHLNKVDLIFNPIFDTSYKGGLKALEFAPSSRVAYNVNSVWTMAVEEYAGFGAVNNLQSGNSASHQLFGVIDHAGKTWDIEVGGGVGLTDAADKFSFKLIVARDLYSRKK